MKTATKLLIGTFALVFLQNRTNAQSTQTGLGIIGHTNAGEVATHYLEWNALSTIPLSIEHKGNFPINFSTNGTQRMKLNGSVTYNINGFNAARDGYLWLGPDAPVGTGTYYNNKGAFSMLHLNGTTTLAAIELGYRPWMKTGVTFTENSDLMYVGRKSSGTNPATSDQTDAVIS